MDILAIDYGRSRVGLALYQNEELFALPILSNRSHFSLIDELIDKITTYNPDLVLLGSPPHGPIQGDVQKVVQTLHNKGIDVHVIDEALTSVQAEHELAMEGASTKERRKRLDSEAALQMIRAYLEEMQRN